MFAVIGVIVGTLLSAGHEALAERRRERRERRVRHDERLWESCVALVTHGTTIAAIVSAGGTTSAPEGPSDQMKACSRALTSIRFLGSPDLVNRANQFFDSVADLLGRTAAIDDRERIGERARALTMAVRIELGLAHED